MHTYCKFILHALLIFYYFMNNLPSLVYEIVSQTSQQGLIEYVLKFVFSYTKAEKSYFLCYIDQVWHILASQEKHSKIIHKNIEEEITEFFLDKETFLLQTIPSFISANFTKEVSNISQQESLLTDTIAVFPLFNKENKSILVLEFANIAHFSEENYLFIQKIIPCIAVTLQNIHTTEVLHNQVHSNKLALQNMQEEIYVRDAALAQKKDEVLQAYQDLKLLSQIGQEIATHLTVSTIIETAYENINKLMDATVFDIGLYNWKDNRIDFFGTIEKGNHLPSHSYHIEKDSKRLAIWCFRKQEKVFINNFALEYDKYFPNEKPLPPTQGRRVSSIIYLPLLLKGKNLGVITVQSYQEDAYTPYHLNILRNLALYVAIALENADAYRKISISSNEIAQQKEEIELKNQSLAKQTEELQQSYNSVKLLGNIGKDITSSLSTFSIIEMVYANINALMDAAVFCIGIYDEKTDSIIFQGGREEGKTLREFSILVTEDRLASWCYKNNQEILINDSQTEYNKYVGGDFQPMAGVNTNSIIYLPLNDKTGHTLGVITIQSFKKNAYNDYHLSMLRNLAIYTGIALENALLYHSLEEKVMQRTEQVVKQKEEVEKSYQNIQLLSKIGFDVTASLSTDTIIEVVYENINKIMDATAFAVGIIQEKTSKIEFRGGMEKGEKLPNFSHSLDDVKRFSVWTVNNRKEVFINNYLRDYKRYIPELKAPEAGEDPESMIYLPLLNQDKIIGVLTVQSFQRNAYTQRHLDILRNLGLYIAIALEKSETYAQIELQKTEIERANQKVTSSINYAQRIQQAILPEQKAFSTALPESFVFFRPKDIVSGDFYWLEENQDKIFVAAVDCTGHGIPGAFMSLIGNEILTEIVTLQHIESPDLILKMLHEKIRRSLRQAESDNRDGMDIAICVLDKHTKSVAYAGAMNPLVYITNGEVQVIRGDKNAAGGIQREAERFFTKHEIDKKDEPTTFYIFSDGYQDQFGGGRKYGLPRMKELFARIYTLDMQEQKVIIENEWLMWKGDENPIDDVLVIGFRW